MNIPLQTEIDISPSKSKIDYQTPVFMMGSCFSDNIGHQLLQVKIPALINPFGVLYNPVSIANSLHRVIENEEITKTSLIEDKQLWHSLHLHGSFSNIDPDKVVEKANLAIVEAHRFLKKTSFLFVTFGTAWVYRFKKTNEIVANCHKISSEQFKRYRLGIDEIVELWMPLINKLKQFNPTLNIVFTVSPVRHFKDGAHENQLSKSVLLLAVDKLINTMRSNCEIGYFASYELVNDELRDYRFYADDMVHLSDLANRYVFEKFDACFFSDTTRQMAKQIQTIILATQHRVLNNNPDALYQFKTNMLIKIDDLLKKYPYIDLNNEKHHFRTLK